MAVAVADCHYHNRPSLKVYILDQIICHFLNYHKKYFLLLHVLPLSICFSFFKWKKIIILKLLAKSEFSAKSEKAAILNDVIHIIHAYHNT